MKLRRQVPAVQIPPAPVLVAGVIFASFSSIFIRLSGAPPLVIAFYRMSFAALILAPFFFVRMLREAAALTGRERRLVLASGVSLGLHFATWITSLSYTSVASSVVLVSTHPILVYILSRVFLGERGTTKQFLFVVLAVAGSAVLSMGDMGKGSHALFGDVLALLGAASMAVYLVIGRSVRARRSLTLYTFLVYAVSALFLMACVFTSGDRFAPYPARDFLLFAALAVVCTLLGHSIYNWALRYLASTFVSVSVLIEPIAASIMAYFFFHEVPNALNAAGAVLVLAGIFGYSRIREKR
jgi:drug/metabolite transporter (DMT)-like permease